MFDKIKEFCKKNKKFISMYCIIVVLCFAVNIGLNIWVSEMQAAEIETISYNEFLVLVDEGKVDTVYYNGSNEYMTITLYNDDTINMSTEEKENYEYSAADKRTVAYPAYSEFRKDMLEKDVTLVVEASSVSWSTILSMIVSLGVPCIWIYLIYKMMKGQMGGMSEDTLLQASNDVKFSNVIGQDEVLEDVKFIVELLKNHELGEEIGAKVPKGILLTGEPGTGKTLIAKAIAGEAGVPFLYVNSSSLIEIYVGMGAKRVRQVFEIAKKHAPCVVFFDEIDSIGCKREGRLSSTEDSQTINALLQEMDGFASRDGIFIIGATNRVDKLDKALIRAGRFDRQIAINPPRDWKVRKQLFDYYLKNFKVCDDIDVENLSKQVSGFTGADIAAICNEASIIAVMQHKPWIDMACMEEAIDKKVFKGNRSKEEHFRDDKTIVAYHEAGHAVMNYLTKQPISRASIIATTSGVGGAVFSADSDSCFITDKELRERIMVAYAGRASEEIKFKTVTTGASNDITQATNIIIAYIERYGFDKNLGLLDMGVLNEQRIVESSDITQRCSKMSKELYSEAFTLLSSKYMLVETLASKLLEVETMSGQEIESLLSNVEEECYE